MSSDDEEFNPDLLEALSAKEEYDSEPSTTSSEDGSRYPSFIVIIRKDHIQNSVGRCQHGSLGNL